MVAENTVWKVRPYGEAVGDYQTVSGWQEQRGLGKLLENTLPPTGIIVEMDGEPVAASWLYLCYGIGVAFWEGMISRPGLSLSQARASCGHCLGALREIARANDIGAIKAYAGATLTHEAQKHGFAVTGHSLFSLITPT